MLVLSDLEQRRPFCIVLEVEAQLICLRERVQVAFCQLVEIFWPEPTHGDHGGLRVFVCLTGRAGFFQRIKGHEGSDVLHVLLVGSLLPELPRRQEVGLIM